MFLTECKSEISKYNLTAVICHHGTVGGGHYTSFAKHESNGRWYEYDDQLVTEVSEEMVKNCEAYVLFYRKINPQMDVIRLQACKLVDASSEIAAADIRFYVSRQWFNKFHTFAEPGPIDNWEFLCQHGAFSPYKAPIKSHLVVALPQLLWDYLYKKFGGGPVCNQLYECEICHRALEMLSRRQKLELETFQMYKDVETPTIYAISYVWFKKWQRFVSSETTMLPGKITNELIVAQSDTGDTQRQPRHGSDYAQINSYLWKFFHDTYDGGPEIILKGNGDELIEAPSPKSQIDSNDVELIDETTIAAKAQEPVYVPVVEEKSPKTIVENSSPIVQQKVVKNVSFEDDDVHSAGSPEPQELSWPSNTNSRYRRRRMRLDGRSSSSTNQSNGEIVSKKDKRHCGGITTNGLFGVEGKILFRFVASLQRQISHSQQNALFCGTGKYQSSYTSLDDEVNSNRIDGINNKEEKETLHNRIRDGLKPVNDTYKKEGGQITSTMADVHSSRKSYRKKHKLKADKKSSYNHHTSNNGDTVLSDSDVN